MVLAHPFWLLLLLLLPLPWIIFRRRGYVGYSDVSLTKGIPGSPILYRLPLVLVSIAVVLLAVALARPQRFEVETSQTIKARDIMIAVDISGSMGSPFAGTIPELTKDDPELDKELPPRPPRPPKPGKDPEAKGGRRIDAAQYAVLSFVRDRHKAQAGDRVGIIVFDHAPYYSWPLTHDLKMMYRKGQFVDEGLGGGTNFGDLDPGPIDAAGAHFDEMGKSATKVLIIVTDGEDNISDSTRNRLEKIIRDRSISFYVIGVGETLARNDVDIITFAQDVGGKVFRVENTQDLQACFQSIHEMERTVIQVNSSKRAEELFFYFAAAAVLFFFLGILSEALILSQ